VLTPFHIISPWRKVFLLIAFPQEWFKPNLVKFHPVVLEMSKIHKFTDGPKKKLTWVFRSRELKYHGVWSLSLIILHYVPNKVLISTVYDFSLTINKMYVLKINTLLLTQVEKIWKDLIHFFAGVGVGRDATTLSDSLIRKVGHVDSSRWNWYEFEISRINF
jgi:hypothetical protein